MGQMFYNINLASVINRNNPIDKVKINQESSKNEARKKDSEWLKGKFIVSDLDLERIDAKNRTMSTAYWKHTTTSLGGNFGINPRPQFTRTADIKARQYRKTSIFANDYNISQKTNIGMGRYYSEAIDDNATLLLFQFGVPRFNSLFDYLTRCVNYEDVYLATHGRTPYLYNTVSLIGKFVMFRAFPFVSGLVFIMKLALNFVSGGAAFNYYYLEPTMHNYFGILNTLVTQVGTELGILTPDFMEKGSEAKKVGIPVTINDEMMSMLSLLLPGIIDKDTNYIDVFRIVTRQQTAHNVSIKAQYDAMMADKGLANDQDYTGYVTAEQTVKKAGMITNNFLMKIDQNVKFTKFIKKLTQDGGLFADKVEDEYTRQNNEKNGIKTPSTTGSDYITEKKDENKPFMRDDSRLEGNTIIAGSEPVKLAEDEKLNKTWAGKFASTFDSVVREGGAFLGLYVDYQGPVTETFSNSYGDIETSGLVKSVAQPIRNLNFNLAGGNLIGGMDMVVDGLKQIVAGAADAVTFGLSNVVMSILGGAVIDLPKKWEDSSMQLPNITYSTTLISPYGDIFSQMVNIYIPLCALLAGTLPQGVGKGGAYASPFLCNIFNKGVQVFSLGMITSLTIERGVSTLGFTKNKRALAIKVNFTVTDFSNLMTAPVNPSIFSNFNLELNDTSTLGTYLGVIGSRDAIQNKYFKPRLARKMAKIRMGVSQLTSASSIGMSLGLVVEPVIGGLLYARGQGLSQSSNSAY